MLFEVATHRRLLTGRDTRNRGVMLITGPITLVTGVVTLATEAVTIVTWLVILVTRSYMREKGDKAP